MSFAIAVIVALHGAPDVTYLGRWDTSSDDAVAAWPMSGFSVVVNGSEVSATLTPGKGG